MNAKSEQYRGQARSAHMVRSVGERKYGSNASRNVAAKDAVHCRRAEGGPQVMATDFMLVTLLFCFVIILV